MNVQEQIAKLESLLDRIKRNGQKPRPAKADTRFAPEASVIAPPPETTRADLTEIAARDAGRVEAPVELAPAVASAEMSLAADVEEIDMMDAEIVEVATTPSGAEEASLEAELEPVPESAPRPAAAVTEELDREPPVKTPPPESGRQAMTPIPAAFAQATEADLTGGRDIDALLETDDSRAPISRAPAGGPSMEQLGETVELAGADAPDAEIELVPVQDEAGAEPDALEVALPKKQFAGAYDAALAPPSTAAADLERHLGAAAPARAIPAPAAPPPQAVPAPAPGRAAPASPIVVDRPAVTETHAAEIVASKPGRVPDTFVELLDASLALKA